MIHITLTDCKWGAEPIEDGVQIDIVHAESEQAFHIPFSGEAVQELALGIFKSLSDDQKRVVMAVLADANHDG